MIGTLLNVAAIVLGGLLGLRFGHIVPERTRQTIISVLGLFVFAIGIQMFLTTENAIIVLISLLLGALFGEALAIEERIRTLGVWLESRYNKNDHSESRSGLFVRGFLTASLVFCTGPMAILGSIQDGLTGNYNLLAIKSVLDGFASLAFASTLGVGVMFSSFLVFIYQGGISLGASFFEQLMSPAMMTEMTASGGLILSALSLSSLLEIKQIRAGNLLPALIFAPIIVAALQAFGWL